MKGVEGRQYGPFEVRTCVERVDDFVAATGDDPGRWRYVAPPGFANALLFAAAPSFFADPEVVSHAGSVIHGDQAFSWARTLPLEQDLRVLGRVERVRSRDGTWFVSFALRADDPEGERFVEASSTFLLAGEPEESETERSEPDAEERAESEVPGRVDVPPEGGELPVLAKSASRADLVRYAAATRDWNPIHWDHRAAARAGLPGVICHGLLMAAWAGQAAGRISGHPAPLADLRVRFRRPLEPAAAAGVLVTAEPPEDDRVRCRVSVTAEGTERATGRASVRLGRTA